MDLFNWIDNLKDDLGKLAKDELKVFIKDSTSDSNEFVHEQAMAMKKNLELLMSENITKDQFDSNLADLEDLVKMQALKESVQAKVRIQRFTDGITKLIRKGLLNII